jgi:phthalate 4,5-dioxygenase
VQESMGPIVDRSKEHLSSTDAAIVTTRRLLLRLLRSPEISPPGILPTYYKVRSTEKVIKRDRRWTEIVAPFLEPQDVRALSDHEPVRTGAVTQ